MNIYKKMMMMTVTASLFMAAPMIASKCASCAEKIALQQSIKDAAAAAIAAGKPTTKHVDSLEQAQENAPCCASCAEGGPCEGNKCGCGKPGKEPKRSADWVAADGSDNSSCCAQMNKLQCALNALVQNKCCQKVKDMLKDQGHAAEKCCRHIRHDLDHIEDLIISQIDEAAICCSVTEALILSQTDRQAACCSVTEALIMTQTDAAAVCCSVTDALILSQTDRQAACCSLIDTNLGDPCATVVDIVNILRLPATVIDVIDTTCLDSITLLKSIYALLVQLLICNPCIS